MGFFRVRLSGCNYTGRERRWSGLVLYCLIALGTAVSAASAPETVTPLTAEERAWLADHPVIRLAPDPDFPPIEFIDEEGTYQGIAADYAALVERRLGIRFIIVKLDTWDEVLKQARSRQIDMFGAASKSPQRATYMNFTRPHIELPGAIIVRREITGELSLQDLKKLRVGVVSGYIWQDLLRNDLPDLKLKKMPDLKTGLQEVSFGSVDAMVANLAIASWYIQREGITNLRVAGETGYFGRYAFASRNDWPQLASILEKTLATITPEEHQAILKRWIAVDAEPSWLSLTTVFVIAGTLGVLLLVLGWNRILNSRVKQRTQDLEQQLQQRYRAETELDKMNSELEQRVTERTASLEQSNERLRIEMEERERVQADLRRFQMTLNETLDCVFMFDDQDLKFLYFNKGAVDQVGYSPEELFRMTPFDIKPDFNEAKFRAFISPFLKRRETARRFETVHQHKDGTLIPVEIFLQYITPDNEPARFVAIVRDITERKKIDKELAWKSRQIKLISDAQQAFIVNTDPRAAFDAMLEGLLELTDSDYGFIGEVLRSAEGEPYLRTHAITNIAWDEATRAFYADHAPKGLEFTNLDTLFGSALKTGEPVIANDPERDSRSGGIPAGHPVLNSFMAIPLYAGKRMVGLVGVANREGGYDRGIIDALGPFSSTCANLIVEYQNEQQRVATEKLVKHKEERLRAVLDNVLESIVTIDRFGIVQSVNPPTADMFGYECEEIVGQNVKMLMPEPHRSAHDQYLANYHSTHSARIIGAGREVEGRHKDGTLFPLELSVTKISTDGEALYVGVLRDITERKRSEQELQLARMNLQRANEQLHEQARTDALTGLANRRHFDETLDREIRHAGRAAEAPLSLFLCDIDYFKLYNDHYGHIDGDACLRQVAKVIRSVFQRAGDLVARYGGEEFAVIMPATRAENAAKVAERLRIAVRDAQIPHAASPVADCVTLSIGIATINSRETISALKFIELADGALYAAKANGRNRVQQHDADFSPQGKRSVVN